MDQLDQLIAEHEQEREDCVLYGGRADGAEARVYKRANGINIPVINVPGVACVTYTYKGRRDSRGRRIFE